MITDHNQRSKKTKFFEKTQIKNSEDSHHTILQIFDKNRSETKTFPWWVSFYRWKMDVQMLI